MGYLFWVGSNILLSMVDQLVVILEVSQEKMSMHPSTSPCGSRPGSSVHGILQARILEWVAIPFSSGSSQTRDRTQISHIASRFFTIWATREAQSFLKQFFFFFFYFRLHFQIVMGLWKNFEDIPDSSAGKESTCNARDPSWIPGSGRPAGEGISYPLQYSWASLVAQTVKNLPALWETWIQSLGWEDPLEEGTTTHSNVLAWRIPMDRRGYNHGIAKSQTWLSK